MMRRFVKMMVSLVLILVVVISMTISAFAWYGPYWHPNGDAGDVHRDDTKRWSLECGMDKLWAVQAAESDAMVDVLYKTALRWHLDRSVYTGESEDTRLLQSKNEMILAKRKIDEAAKYEEQRKSAVSRWDKAKYVLKLAKAKEEAIICLGRCLHPVQDIYAHMDAGKNKTDAEIGLTHGTLDADPVDVTVVYEDGTTSIRQMKLEQKDDYGRLYSLYDDVFYDYDGGWIFRVNGLKESNIRWQNTKAASVEKIRELMNYAAEKGISFDKP